MEFNLRGIDLNLLPVFEAAYEERSLSRAAQRLAMTQPAMSHALGRLRFVFKDELFIRHSRGMTPTAAADAIYARLRGALDSVREVVNEASDFDPAVSSRRFFVSIPHPLGPTIALRLIERLELAAPQIKIEFSSRSRPINLERDLHDGSADIAIDWLPPSDAALHSTVLFNDLLVPIARKNHAVFKQSVTVKRLQAESFVSLRRRVKPAPQIPGLKEWVDLDLNVTLEVSELLEVLLVVSQSNLIGLMAHSMATIAEDVFKVRTLAVPFKTAPVPVRMIWPPRRESDPGHAYLREQITAAVAEVLGEVVGT